MKMGVDSKGERSSLVLAGVEAELVGHHTFLMIACLPAFENPSNGFPERTGTEIPSSLLVVADNGSSP